MGQTLLCEIDQNLQNQRFDCLEKIKTIGAVYMIASGLHETRRKSTVMRHHLSMTEDDGYKELCQLAEFAVNYRFTVLRFNKEHKTNFNVQVGLAYGGQVMAGVIGNTAPQYDILGPT